MDSKIKKMIAQRQGMNRKIIQRLAEIIEKEPQMRFGQILGNFVLEYEVDRINDVQTVKDPFYEESVVTWDRLKEYYDDEN